MGMSRVAFFAAWAAGVCTAMMTSRSWNFPDACEECRKSMTLLSVRQPVTLRLHVTPNGQVGTFRSRQLAKDEPMPVIKRPHCLYASQPEDGCNVECRSPLTLIVARQVLRRNILHSGPKPAVSATSALSQLHLNEQTSVAAAGRSLARQRPTPRLWFQRRVGRRSPAVGQEHTISVVCAARQLLATAATLPRAQPGSRDGWARLRRRDAFAIYDPGR
jgi:hypothetical protein